MRKAPRTGFALTILSAVGMVALLLATGPRAEARPNYKKAFDADFKEKLGKTNCDVCHVPKKPKKLRNAYGEAIKEGLPMKNTKDMDAIKAAILAANEKDSGDGTTFGERIEAGKNPVEAE